MNLNKLTIADVDCNDKRVLMRVDFSKRARTFHARVAHARAFPCTRPQTRR